MTTIFPAQHDENQKLRRAAAEQNFDNARAALKAATELLAGLQRKKANGDIVRPIQLDRAEHAAQEAQKEFDAAKSRLAMWAPNTIESNRSPMSDQPRRRTRR